MSTRAVKRSLGALTEDEMVNLCIRQRKRLREMYHTAIDCIRTATENGEPVDHFVDKIDINKYAGNATPIEREIDHTLGYDKYDFGVDDTPLTQ